MCGIVGALLLIGVGLAASLPAPAKDALMFEMGGDTAVVESTVREARQVPANLRELLKPGVKDAFILTYGNKEGDAGNVQGYSKKMNDRGNEGYEHFDSFQKSDSDKYGFEVHKEFGKSGKAGVDVKNKRGGYSDQENEGAEESKTLYRVSGETKEDDKDKNKFAVDGYDHAYYGGEGGTDKTSGGKSENGNEGGGSENYEVNESYASGGSTSYEGGHNNEKDDNGSYSSGSGDGKSQSYSAEKEEDNEEDEEDED